MKSIYNLATILSVMAFIPSDVAGSAPSVGENIVDGAKVILSAQDVKNVMELAKDENWTAEQVLSYAHGLVLDGKHPDVSSALQRGIDEFSGAYTNGADAVEAMTALYGDDLADDDDDFGLEDDIDPELVAFFDDLFGDDEGDDA